MKKIEFELINSMLENNNIYRKLDINYKAFENIITKSLFKFIGEKIAKNGAFDVLEINEDIYNKLNIKGGLDDLEVDDAVQLRRYIKSFNNTKKWKNNQRLLRTRYNRKKIKEIADQMIQDADNSAIEPEELLRKSAYNVDKLLFDNDDEIEMASGVSILEDERKYQKSDQKIEFLKTGLKLIDEGIGGLPTPNVTCLAAKNKTGKSIWLEETTVGLLKNGYKVLHVTIEMDIPSKRRRILSSFSRHGFNKITQKDWLEESDFKDYMGKLDEFEKYAKNLYLLHKKTGVCTKDIEGRVKELERAGIELDAIIIDHVSLLRSSNPKLTTKVEKAGSIPREVRLLKQKIGKAILTAQQMHSRIDGKDIERVSEDDIYYMKETTHEFNNVLLLHQKSKGEPMKLRTLVSRDGLDDSVRYFPDMNRDIISLGQDEVYLEIDSNEVDEDGDIL